jgi:hypothetical protein
VIDDPIKALDALWEAERRRVWEFYSGTLCTRLDDKQNGAIVIIMQRLHTEDLVGRLLDLEAEAWEVVSIPAIATEDKSYQLSDTPDDIYFRPAGEVLHKEREPLPVLDEIRRAQGSLNFSAQYQQAPVAPGGNVIRRDWLRYYATPPAIIALHTRYQAAVTLIEETELGRALAQDLHRTGHLRSLTFHPERDKLARLLAQAAR